MSVIITPESPLFYPTLYGTLPPNTDRGACFIVRADNPLLVPATNDELEDYLNSGEYDQRLSDIGWESDWDEPESD